MILIVTDSRRPGWTAVHHNVPAGLEPKEICKRYGIAAHCMVQVFDDEMGGEIGVHIDGNKRQLRSS
jgi:hypothetical protein